MSDELRYGIIKYNKKENAFFIISSNRTMIYMIQELVSLI